MSRETHPVPIALLTMAITAIERRSKTVAGLDVAEKLRAELAKARRLPMLNMARRDDGSPIHLVPDGHHRALCLTDCLNYLPAYNGAAGPACDRCWLLAETKGHPMPTLAPEPSASGALSLNLTPENPDA